MSASSAKTAALPMGVGRIGPSWIAACVALLALIGLGAWGYLQQRLHGDVVTGMRTIGQGGSAWGLYICFDIVLVGLAFAGISLTALTRVFRIRELWPLSRMAEVLAVASLSAAGLCVIADLGRPLHGLIYLPKFARTASPFFGTFTLVIGTGLSACVVYLFLDGRADAAWYAQRAGRWSWFYRLCAVGYRDTRAEQLRHRRVSFWLSMLLLPLMIVAYSTLGFVFGIQGGRPGWYSTTQAPGFVVLAALSGVGLLLAIAAAVRRALRLENEIPLVAFRWLGNALGVLILVHLYIVGVEELTASYAGFEAQSELAREVSRGTFAPLFWTMIATFVVPLVVLFVQGVRRATSPATAAAAGLLVNVGAVIKRYLIVVPSQTHGQLLPWPAGRYVPTWVELSVVGGLLAFAALMYLVFLKIFPVLPLQSVGILPHEYSLSSPRTSAPLRRTLTIVTLAIGLTLSLVGLLSSARVGTLPYLDPVLPFSPVLFIVGMGVSLLSAVVYETWPTRAAKNAEG